MCEGAHWVALEGLYARHVLGGGGGMRGACVLDGRSDTCPIEGRVWVND